MLKSSLLVLIVLALAVPQSATATEDLPAVAPVTACADLAQMSFSLPEAPTIITAADEQSVNGHDMCVIKGTISPRVSFEVHLPVTGWTQRYLQTGCGGLCGRLGIDSPQRDCTPEVDGAMAMASTDMGHDTDGGTWGASDMQLRVDFGYRGVHVTALIAKRLIEAYYGQPAKYAYFSGCSDGGREALMEAQRYPDDFDGIAAGAAALNFLVQNSLHHGWSAKIIQPDSDAPNLTAADLPVLHEGVVATCDMLDGVADGLIGQPVACAGVFDPQTLICAGAQSEGCLSKKAADAAAAIYKGAHDGETKLVVGALLPGSEAEWAGVLVPAGTPTGSAPPAEDAAPQAASAEGDKPAMDQLVMKGPMGTLAPKVTREMVQSLAYTTPFDLDWTLDDLRFDATQIEAMRDMHAIFDATDPNLAPFREAGGKLIIWHGLADPHISPLNSVGYVQAVRDTIGAEASDDMLRLFLIPGMAHCGGGKGLTSIDVMTALMDWVESGKAPESLVASSTDEDAAAGQGRRLFPFPATSVMMQSGDPTDPAAWIAGPAFEVGNTIYKDWAGADLFRPGFQKFCGFEGMAFVCRH